MKQPISADDFIPNFILLIVKFNPKLIRLNVNFIERYQTNMDGERMYYFTTLLSVIHFIDHMTAKDVAMNESDFQKLTSEHNEEFYVKEKEEKEKVGQTFSEEIKVENNQEDDKDSLFNSKIMKFTEASEFPLTDLPSFFQYYKKLGRQKIDNCSPITFSKLSIEEKIKKSRLLFFLSFPYFSNYL